MRRYSYVFIFVALLLALSAAFCAAVVPGEKEDLPEDKYVRLMSAQSVQLLEIDGKTYRKAEGPARFLHNDTWLICDTALWNVDEQLIHAFGHVSIEQDETELRGDSLVYIVKEDLAKFRGHVVELQDKDGNILRTRNLDYNTKDSIAVFRGGGSMKDSKGQVIESIDGTYESKAKLFTFRDQVDMFTDSVFIKTSLLFYNTEQKLATFPEYVEAWKEDKMLSASSGWYKRDVEKFFFTDNVHTMSEDKEGWCDTLIYRKLDGDVELLGNAQITDSIRNVTSLGGYMHYVDSVSRLMLTQDPVVIIKVEDDDAYTRADTLYYWTEKRCEIDSLVVVQAKERVAQINVDPVANMRAKAAEELAKKIKEAQENDPNRPPEIPAAGGRGAGGAGGKGVDGRGSSSADGSGRGASAGGRAADDAAGGKGVDGRGGSAGGGSSSADGYGRGAGGAADGSLEMGAIDSVALALKDSLARADSLHIADSIAAARSDTTKIGFLRAVNKVKMFRPKMQLICDSLVYSDLDSIVRMFKSPVIWNENHQYSSDSILVVLDSGKMRKANLLSNAFIHIEEQREMYYDQIRSLEMMAYFNDSTKLSRFDALGSVTALFYLNEKGKIGSANRKECSMMSAEFENGEVRKISYYEAPKSNAYPVAQMRKDEKFLKGFGWLADQCPRSPSDLTSRVPRASERNLYAAHPKTVFKQTDTYFPGYFAQVYKDLARADSLRRAAKLQATKVEGGDSLSVGADSLATETPDSLASQTASSDSLSASASAAGADSLAAAGGAAGAGAAVAAGAAGAASLAAGGTGSVAAAGGSAVGAVGSGLAAALGSSADSLARADSIASADSLAALPKIPDGYILVHTDDDTHPGIIGIGHVTILDTLQRLVNLDSLQLKLYIDTTAACAVLPDSRPRDALSDTLSSSQSSALPSHPSSTLPSHPSSTLPDHPSSTRPNSRPRAVVLDTAGVLTSIDSLSMSLVIVPLTAGEIKKIEAQQAREARQKAYEQKRAAANAKREARWKALDERDAAKQAAKEAKKQAREKARQEKLLRTMAEQQAKEAALLKAYTDRYFKKMVGAL